MGVRRMFFRKNRTKLKKWLDRQGIEQQELAKNLKCLQKQLVKHVETQIISPNLKS